MTYLQTINRLLIHKWLVAYYARRHFPWRISRFDALIIFLCHDSDKFLHLPSVRYRFETGDETEFSHWHTLTQKHHWRHWNWLNIMPNRYICEMIADWFSASQLETGNAWDALDFAEKEIETMRKRRTASKTVENVEWYISHLKKLIDLAKWSVEQTKEK